MQRGDYVVSRFTSRNKRLLGPDVGLPSVPSPYMAGEGTAFRNDVTMPQV